MLQRTTKRTGKDTKQILTREGPRQHVRIALGGGVLSAVVPEKQEVLDSLPSFKTPTLIENSFPKIPWDSIDGGVLQAWLYFKAVYEAHRSEAFIWWHWDKTAEKYVMVVPPYYYVSGGGLEYPASVSVFCRTCCVALYQGGVVCPHCPNGVIEKLFVAGTSHSHAAMSPFHSGEDHANELDSTGFHITFGHLDRDLPIAGSFVIADGHTRFNTDWTAHFARHDPIEWEKKLSRWVTLVSPARSQLRSARLEVVHDGGVVFAHGERSACETWITSQANPAAFTIREATAPVEKPKAPVQRIKMERERSVTVRKEGTSKAPEKQFSVHWLLVLLDEVPEELQVLAYVTVLDSINAHDPGGFEAVEPSALTRSLLNSIDNPFDVFKGWLEEINERIGKTFGADATSEMPDEHVVVNELVAKVAEHARQMGMEGIADKITEFESYQ